MTENEKLDLILSEVKDMRTDILNMQERYIAMSGNQYETICNRRIVFYPVCKEE